MDVEEDKNVRASVVALFGGKSKVHREAELPEFAARFGILLSSHFICNTATCVAKIAEESLPATLQHIDKNMRQTAKYFNFL